MLIPRRHFSSLRRKATRQACAPWARGVPGLGILERPAHQTTLWVEECLGPWCTTVVITTEREVHNNVRRTLNCTSCVSVAGLGKSGFCFAIWGNPFVVCVNSYSSCCGCEEEVQKLNKRETFSCQALKSNHSQQMNCQGDFIHKEVFH